MTLRPRDLAREWRDRKKQQRCNICGRFAYWDAPSESWKLGCVSWDDYMGAYEHD